MNFKMARESRRSYGGATRTIHGQSPHVEHNENGVRKEPLSMRTLKQERAEVMEEGARAICHPAGRETGNQASRGRSTIYMSTSYH